MKEYIIKFFPVPNDESYINNGDFVWYKEKLKIVKSIQYDPIFKIELNGNRDKSITLKQLRKVKPYVCSHNIKQGDKFINPNNYEEYTATEVIPVFNSRLTNVYSWGKDKLGFTNTDLFKIEGQVWPLKWLKDGDIFKEKDVKIKQEWTDKRGKYLEIGDEVKLNIHDFGVGFDVIGTIENIISIEDGVWDWEDQVYLKDVHLKCFFKNSKLNKESENIVTIRSNVQFNGKPYLYFELKCPTCGDFH